jgi:hypothetical protein
MAPVVEAFQAMRGVAFVAAVKVAISRASIICDK